MAAKHLCFVVYHSIGSIRIFSKKSIYSPPIKILPLRTQVYQFFFIYPRNINIPVLFVMILEVFVYFGIFHIVCEWKVYHIIGVGSFISFESNILLHESGKYIIKTFLIKFSLKIENFTHFWLNC